MKLAFVATSKLMSCSRKIIIHVLVCFPWFNLTAMVPDKASHLCNNASGNKINDYFCQGNKKV